MTRIEELERARIEAMKEGNCHAAADAIMEKAVLAGAGKPRGITTITYYGPGSVRLGLAGVNVSVEKLSNGRAALLFTDSRKPLAFATFPEGNTPRFRVEWQRKGYDFNYRVSALGGTTEESPFTWKSIQLTQGGPADIGPLVPMA